MAAFDLPAPARSRRTWQRAAVEELVSRTTEFRSVQQLHADLERQGQRVGLSTVYRTLQQLAELGAVDVLHREDGESAYRRCSAGHHHHLVCRSCGGTVEVEAAGVERWAAQVARAHGYSDVEHTLEIVGLCPQCGARARGARVPADNPGNPRN